MPNWGVVLKGQIGHAFTWLNSWIVLIECFLTETPFVYTSFNDVIASVETWRKRCFCNVFSRYLVYLRRYKDANEVIISLAICP